MSCFVRKLKAIQKSKSLGNIVYTTYIIRCLRKMVGASVITIECTNKERVISTFSWFGFITFIIWYSSYFYSVFISFVEDQTLLRTLYNTRLQHYGDDVERLTGSIFVLYAMWKVPFDLSGSTEDFQLIIDIDKALQDLGEQVNYTKSINLAIIIILAQTGITGTRIFSVWISLLHTGPVMPLEKIYQMIFTDTLVFIITAQYCSYLLILKRRYKLVNTSLNSIRLRASSKLFMLRFKRWPEINFVNEMHEKYSLSKHIKLCGRIYGMLFKATQTANNKFGLVLLFMMFKSLLFIVLYLYYFMEATASGLFHDYEKYVDFLIYVFWQIGYSFSVILVCLYFSEVTVKEARDVSQVTHEIINSDLDITVETQALNLSLQILHQKPLFTAYGLFRLDYVVLLEGARSVTTFLVILLQFVTDKR